MSKRDEVFETFGPLLLEGCLRIILDEINILREEAGLENRTLLQFYEQIMNHQSTLVPYEWMV